MITLSKKEALARIVEGDPVRVCFQKLSHAGATWAYVVERPGLLALLGQADAMEAGVLGQKVDMGVYVEFRHNVHGHGYLFIATKPACRLGQAELTESVVHGHSKDLFSAIKPVEDSARQRHVQKLRDARYRMLRKVRMGQA